MASISFEEFATFHSVHPDEWNFLYTHGIAGNRNWHHLMNVVMYCPKTTYHDHIENPLMKEYYNDTRKWDECIEFNRLVNLGHIDATKYKRGDIIEVFESEMIWDGNQAIDMEYDYSNYGIIPSQTPIGKEFPINYWNNNGGLPRKYASVNFGADVGRKYLDFCNYCQRYSECNDDDKYFQFDFNGKQWLIAIYDMLSGLVMDAHGRGVVEYKPLGDHIEGNWYQCSPKHLLVTKRFSNVPPENIMWQM